jgi:hypothetical protein
VVVDAHSERWPSLACDNIIMARHFASRSATLAKCKLSASWCSASSDCTVTSVVLIVSAGDHPSLSISRHRSGGEPVRELTLGCQTAGSNSNLGGTN